MRVLLVQSTRFINGEGGTEKICSFLANAFSSMNHHVEIATNEDVVGKNKFYLNPDIKIRNVYNPENKIVELHRILNYKGKNPFLWIIHKTKKKYHKYQNRKLKKKYGSGEGLYLHNLNERSKLWIPFLEHNKYDLIITMSISSLLELTYVNNINTPIVNSTNGRPDYDYTDDLWFREEVEKQLLKSAYKQLKGIQVLFESYRNYLPETFDGVCHVIPNFVNQPAENRIVRHDNNKERLVIIHIGSLVTSCKQQDVAIDVFSTLSAEYPNWELHFYGTGDDYDDLQKKIANLDLSHKVFLKGFTDSPIEKLSQADIFIFPSKYEGFPLALIEAMSIGLPAVGFLNCSGVNELIIDRETGFLCADKEDMKQKIELLMKDPALRKDFGYKSYSASKHYDPDRIIESWKAFAIEITEKIK